MKRKALRALLCLFMLLAFAGGKYMDEGMWLLDSVNKLPLADMKKHGLELTPEQIYSANGPSLKDAIILLGGGTASFVSPDGLIVTNHHVAFGGIQSLSSVQTDYLKNGFWAKSRAEELSTTYTAQVVKDIKEVTAEVLSAVSDTMSAGTRAKAIEGRSREIEKQAKGNSDLICRVSDMYNGVKYYLFTYETLSDIRLVYAPPNAIGNYGGEVDNWMWPRHTGDFSLMRAYVGSDGKPAKFSQENVPYKPKKFLPISTKGYSEGSFAMIMGFPGRTFRYREASAIELARNETLPTTVDLYKTRMDIIEKAGAKNRDVEIKYASRLRGLANTYKNYLGTLEGMRHANLLGEKQKEEAVFVAHVKADPGLAARYGTVLQELASLNAELSKFNRKNILAINLATGVDLLRIANRLRAYAVAPSPKEKDNMRSFILSTFKDLTLDVDKETLTALILKSAAMPSDQQFHLFQAAYGTKTGADLDEAVRDYVDDLYSSTALATPEGCQKLLDDPADISDDDFVKFAAAFEQEQAPLAARVNAYNTAIAPLRARYIEALIDWNKSQVIYPDANRTLRFTYGTVKPYDPRDAVSYRYYTTLSGVIEKETGEDPFIVPAKLKELWEKKDFGPYADPKIGDVPVAFLSDLDITGGNSGSPVINGKGELIGCVFDLNWEAVVGDYMFNEKLQRAISVDTRYMLFVLDKFSGAENILKELEIH